VRHRVHRPVATLLVAAVWLAGCGADAALPSTAPPSSSAPPSAAGSAPSSAGAPAVEPAPGSGSSVYAPNPGAIVVALDAGHGGCLDWGVPDPSERGPAFAEETMTLAIAGRARELLEGEGVTVLMIRDEDEALAGDDYPPLDCHGPPWRDVNGDGAVGFGPDVPEATRTRDELQARLDLANLAMADALVSIHINSPSEGGEQVAIAFSETFYTDETPWGADRTARLAAGVQEGVVAQLDAVADYDRGDRGVTAHNFYMVAPTLFAPTEDRPDPLKQPTRGGLMPVVLSEVGSITLRQEHDLLVSPEGQSAVARGIVDGLAAFLGDRPMAARIGLADKEHGWVPDEAPGAGPPFWPEVAPEGPFEFRVTNTGTAPWPAGMTLVAGWGTTDEPYLASAPQELSDLDIEVPPLAPGESVIVPVDLPPPPAASRAVAWISLSAGGSTLADDGSPALQLGSGAP
jgi:N-acetylmuramoyl-L-alanine amidase